MHWPFVFSMKLSQVKMRDKLTQSKILRGAVGFAVEKVITKCTGYEAAHEHPISAGRVSFSRWFVGVSTGEISKPKDGVCKDIFYFQSKR